MPGLRPPGLRATDTFSLCRARSEQARRFTALVSSSGGFASLQRRTGGRVAWSCAWLVRDAAPLSVPCVSVSLYGRLASLYEPPLRPAPSITVGRFAAALGDV